MRKIIVIVLFTMLIPNKLDAQNDVKSAFLMNYPEADRLCRNYVEY